MSMLSIVLYISVLFHVIDASTWLECTNYDPPAFEHDLMGNFERSRCKGYPRNFGNQYSSGFGVDTNYQWTGADCSRDSYNPTDYTSVTPMATYIAGETVYLIHPSKLLVADVCTNSLIP